MASALTPTSWFYSLYCHTPHTQKQRDITSRSKNSFLLVSDASISVLNYPTYITIAELLNITRNGTINPSKTLTVANQTDVCFLHYVTLILRTTSQDYSRQFIFPFVVANTSYNILGVSFVEDYIQNINIQDLTLQFKDHSKVHPSYTKFTSLLSKSYPYFSYRYRINSRSKIHAKYNSSEINCAFPIKNYNFHFTTTPKKVFSLKPHTYFSTKFLQHST